jgi:hypothetical protein
MPKLDSMAVFDQSWFSVTWATASRFSSITMRMPVRSDSSRTSEMPSTFFSPTSSAIRSMSLALFTWYGSSVTTICSKSFLRSSTSATARTLMMPRPVS